MTNCEFIGLCKYYQNWTAIVGSNMESCFCTSKPSECEHRDKAIVALEQSGVIRI